MRLSLQSTSAVLHVATLAIPQLNLDSLIDCDLIIVWSAYAHGHAVCFYVEYFMFH